MMNRLEFLRLQTLQFQNFRFLCGCCFGRACGSTICSTDENSNTFQHGSSSFSPCGSLVAVGGRGSLGGAILGALSVNLLYNYLTSEHDYGFFSWSPDYWPIFLGIMFVLVVLFLPKGLIEIVEKFTKRFRPEISKKVEVSS